VNADCSVQFFEIYSFSGKQWSGDVINYLMDLAYKNESYVLIDDAYYCVHDPTVEVVNTLKIWLKRLDENKNR
jgi:hypothetical protein